MNWERIEGNWKQLKGQAKEQWGKLTDDQLTEIAGKRDQLAGKIQE
ncbi:MAG: CsbD family protein, partial [Thiomonas sp.]